MNQADWVAGRLGPHNTREAGTKRRSLGHLLGCQGSSNCAGVSEEPCLWASAWETRHFNLILKREKWE